MSSKIVTLKAGEMLFVEGDPSKSLYFLKRGVVRIFKKKGVGSIEIDSIRAGQVLGELAFFDNQARSASAEALTQVELIEISKETLDDAISKIPEWLSALIKTITARLRNTNNRLRALESISTDYETDKYGNRSKEFTYVNTSELLKFCTALLAVSARYGKPTDNGQISFSENQLETFASNILQVSSSKVLSLIETFKTVQILSYESTLIDIKFLDQLIQYLNEQNLVEPSKKRILSEVGFEVMQLIVKNKKSAVKVDEAMEKINIAPLLAGAGLTLNQTQELATQAFADSIDMVSGEEAYVRYKVQKFDFEYKVYWLLNEIGKLNESKRKGPTHGGTGAT